MEEESMNTKDKLRNTIRLIKKNQNIFNNIYHTNTNDKSICEKNIEKVRKNYEKWGL
jgi:hypothetical protein